jgi:hypothetical protein
LLTKALPHRQRFPDVPAAPTVTWPKPPPGSTGGDHGGWWRTLGDEVDRRSGPAGPDRVCVRLDGRKRVRGETSTTVGALADAEKLRPVPAPYPARLQVSRTVSNRARISFRGNTYSVPPGHAGRRLLVRHRLGDPMLEVLTDTGVVLARHPRAPRWCRHDVCAPEHVVALEKVVLANFVDRPPVSGQTSAPTVGRGAGRGRPHPRQGSGTRGSAGGGRHGGRARGAAGRRSRNPLRRANRTAGRPAPWSAKWPPRGCAGTPQGSRTGRRAGETGAPHEDQPAEDPASEVTWRRRDPDQWLGTAGDKTYQVVRGKTKDGRLTWVTTLQIKRRCLLAVEIKPGSNGCAVLSGTLHDPYTGTTIDFQRDADTSTQVQIDHIALSDAWQKGAQQWDAGQPSACDQKRRHVIDVGPVALRAFLIRPGLRFSHPFPRLAFRLNIAHGRSLRPD